MFNRQQESRVVAIKRHFTVKNYVAKLLDYFKCLLFQGLLRFFPILLEYVEELQLETG